MTHEYGTDHDCETCAELRDQLNDTASDDTRKQVEELAREGYITQTHRAVSKMSDASRDGDVGRVAQMLASIEQASEHFALVIRWLLATDAMPGATPVELLNLLELDPDDAAVLLSHGLIEGSLLGITVVDDTDSNEPNPN
jgi:hypothetical protein